MAFTSAQLTDIRRFCGYPVFGATPSGFQSYRFFQSFGFLEYRMQNLTSDESNVVINTYLTNLYLLETDIVGTRTNLDTDSAAVWKHNKNEQADRESLYRSWRMELCRFMGVPPGPGLETGVRMVV